MSVVARYSAFGFEIAAKYPYKLFKYQSDCDIQGLDDLGVLAIVS